MTDTDRLIEIPLFPPMLLAFVTTHRFIFYFSISMLNEITALKEKYK